MKIHMLIRFHVRHSVDAFTLLCKAMQEIRRPKKLKKIISLSNISASKYLLIIANFNVLQIHQKSLLAFILEV